MSVNLAHVLGSTCENNVDFLKANILGAQDNRLEARAAQTIDGEAGGLDATTRLQANVTCKICRVLGCLLNLRCVNTGQLQHKITMIIDKTHDIMTPIAWNENWRQIIQGNDGLHVKILSLHICHFYG